jgi:hypothetical protein
VLLGEASPEILSRASAHFSAVTLLAFALVAIDRRLGGAMRKFNCPGKDRRGFVRVRAVGVVVVIVGTFAVGNALAALSGSRATKLCIPKAAGSPVKTPTSKGHCPRRYKLAELGREGQPGREGRQGPKGERGERGEPGQVEALQFTVYGGGLHTGGQVVSVPAGSYGSETVPPENTIFYGPVNFGATSVVAAIYVSGRERLGEATADCTSKTWLERKLLVV